MSFRDVLFERRAPKLVSVSGVEVLRGSVHDQQFFAHSALPRYAAKLSEECEVMCHEASIAVAVFPRNLRQ